MFTSTEKIPVLIGKDGRRPEVSCRIGSFRLERNRVRLVVVDLYVSIQIMGGRGPVGKRFPYDQTVITRRLSEIDAGMTYRPKT